MDDEPGITDSGTGTTLFHRDETYSDGKDVTGSGAYLGWPADGAYAGTAAADYQSVETASYSVADSYAVNGDHSTGYDEETGDPYDLLFNYSNASTGSGNLTITSNYHDGNDGMELAGESFAGSGSSNATVRSWGTQNGVAFDDTSVTPDSWNTSFSLPGGSGPIPTADGLAGVFPLQSMTMPPSIFFTADPIPTPPTTTIVPGLPGKVQDWYNQHAIQNGNAGLKKGAEAFLKKNLIETFLNQPNGANAPSGGTFDSPNGGTFSLAFGTGDKVDEDDAAQQELMRKAGYTNIKLASTGVRITYAFDQANQNPRSGKVTVQYKILLNYTATDKNGKPVTPGRDSVVGFLTIEDDAFKTMALKLVP